MRISDIIESKQNKMSAEKSWEEFCEQFPTAAAWLSRGWSELPQVNREGQRDSKELNSEVTLSCEYLLSESREWFKHVVEIDNQEIIRLNRRF